MCDAGHHNVDFAGEDAGDAHEDDDADDDDDDDDDEDND